MAYNQLTPQEAAVILDEANALANRAVTGRPEYASFHETQARILLAQQRLPEAEAAIDRCAELGLETTLLRQQLMDVEAAAKAAFDSASESGQTSDSEPAQAPDDDSSASLPRERFDAGTSQAGPILTTFLQDKQTSVRIATFNASLNRAAAGTLISDLQTPDNRQAQAVAEIIQRTRPDVLLINEFDFDDQSVAADSEALRLFRKNYLQVSQNGCEPIQYDFHFTAPSNTGVPSGMDLNNDGMISGGNDAFGFGDFPGQYGMVLLSKYPIVAAEIRTFQKFLWKDMPDSLLPPDPADSDGDGDRSSFFTPAELDVVRLSSKSHWDIPVDIGGQIIHMLASHPTPPVFDDGRETDFENPTLVDRNGRRNHDEIRFWADYVAAARYIYDDNEWTAAGNRTPTVASGGLKPGTKFVILGDLNADPHDGDNTGNPAAMLLNSPLIGAVPVPTSSGAAEAARVQGQANATHRGDPAADTADFGDRSPGNLRVDYVLPSANLKVLNAEVFWPDVAELNELGNPNLLGPRDGGASDHRLVFVDLSL